MKLHTYINFKKHCSYQFLTIIQLSLIIQLSYQAVLINYS